MKKRAPGAIIRTVTNPLKFKYLKRAAWGVGVWMAVGCGHKPADKSAPQPTAPLPTAALAGQRVIVLPFTLVAAEDSLRWETLLADRRATLARADSILGALLGARAPEITWVPPDELRRAARRAPGIATDPDQLATAILRAKNLNVVPDPLRTQLRTIAALAGGDNGRFALVPAALIYRRPAARVEGGTVRPVAPGVGIAELAIVLADVRLGRVGWRTVATGAGDDPWSALTRAVKGLTPGLP